MDSVSLLHLNTSATMSEVTRVCMAVFILRSLPVLPKDTVTPFLKVCVIIGGLDQRLHYHRGEPTP